MKIAYCISGQPRFFSKGFNLMYLEFISKNSEHTIDVFIHTWFNNNLINQKYEASYWNINNSDTYKENCLHELYNLYNPKKIKIEHPISFNLRQEYSNNKAKQETNITFSMFNSIYKCNELKKEYEKETLIKYDKVIRVRFDWYLSNQVIINELLDDYLYVPNLCPTENAYNDQFAIGSTSDIDIYCDVFNNIENYWYFDNIILSNESLLYHHLKKNNLTHKVKQMSNNLNFIRN